jgi:hypothetical protein
MSSKDVAQTEGADLPEFEHNITGEVGEHRNRLIAFLDSQNIALEYNENIAPALGVSYGGRLPFYPARRPPRIWSVWSMKRRTNFCTRATAAP